MPDDTVVDGEVVALDPEGRPSFNLLQNYGSARAPLHFFVFDVLILKGEDVMGQPLMKRRQLIEKHVLPKLEEPVRYSPILQGRLNNLVHSVKAQRLEGLIAKRCDSKYEAGLRSGAWVKMRVDAGQEFVIGGYTPSPKNFDALVIGYYDEPKLVYAARTRNGFTPASRAQLFKRLKPLEMDECPFANLPEKKAGRWGARLTAAKMEECRWLLCRMRHSSHHAESRIMPNRRRCGRVRMRLDSAGVRHSFVHAGPSNGDVRLDPAELWRPNND